MNTTYVKTRSELIGQMLEHANKGFQCYRIRESCACCEPKDDTKIIRNRDRNAVLIIKGDMVIGRVIHCKSCAACMGNMFI